MTDYLILVSAGYLLGSIPFGVIAGWLVRRVDVRDFGSGSTGMTNVLRTVGRPAAVVVLLLDMAKAVSAVVLARAVSDEHGVEVAAALAALVGHNWPVFIGFRGGKGTASGWAGLLILSPLAGLVATVGGASTIVLSRYVSLGSVLGATAGAVSLTVIAVTGHVPLVYIWFGAIGSPLILARHWENMRRLLSGQERKLGQPVKGISPEVEGRKGVGWPRSV
ncbi:MAG: glycerol-3-phosphate 1-O-acyltransferase PlsY [Chloroflexi bacterium]|nr:glycerol-3-phosphate 1-O-acyltransferase PlsY [Chloroflexota bacterium]